jgi:hypothetical protein
MFLSAILSFLGGNLLSNLATAAMAIFRGVVAIIVDLSGSREGRIVLAVAVVACLSLYARHYYINQGRESCPVCKSCTPRAAPSQDIWDMFKHD